MVVSELVRPTPLPPWIRVRPPHGNYPEVRSLLEEYRLTTVCREARCPNLSECWSAGTATLMLLGAECSRRCGFCAVNTHWPQGVVDSSEPRRVGEAVARWGLRYVVLTQVCRDDLEDGGASILAETIERLRALAPETRIELLAGDLGGSRAALALALRTPPDVFAHNVETVPRLSPQVRDRRAGYEGSRAFLRAARSLGGPRLVTKSSIMLGLGETDEEIRRAMQDLRDVGVDLVTFGQYLRPSSRHVPVARYVLPEEFDAWKREALQLGFAGVEAGPLVRSSFHAEQLYRAAFEARGG